MTEPGIRIRQLEAALVRMAIGFMREAGNQLSMPPNVAVNITNTDWQVRVSLDDGTRVYASMPVDQATLPVRALGREK